MNLLAPAALWFFLLAGPILVLYMLKLRRNQVTISSTMLWQQILRDRQANSPWQRLMRNLLLLLQLLILSALVLALARPVQPVPGVSASSVIILLDASASMNAQDVSPSRFEAARQIAQTYITDLASDARMTIITVGPEPRILIARQNNRNALRQALQEASPSQGPADWPAAFTLAAGAAGGASPARRASIATVIVSDGGLPASGLPDLPGEVTFIPIGQDGNNLAITALAVRSGGNGPELFTSVKNYGSPTANVILSVYAEGRLLLSRQVELQGGETQSLTVNDLTPDALRYEARIQPLGSQDTEFNDNLPLDNRAATVYRPARSGKVLLVSAGNLFLEQLLATLGGIQPYRVLPAEDGSLALPAETFDLYVLDGLQPQPMPEGNILWINPPASELLPSMGVFTDTSPAEVVQSPLTEFVNWQDVHILRARQIVEPDWAQTVINAPGGPLVLAGELQGHRIALITFDLHDSDLPLQTAFPILIANLIDFLQPGEPYHLEDLPALTPGQRVSLPAAATSGVLRMENPSGQIAEIRPDIDSQFLLQLNQTGIYRLSDPAEPDRQGLLAVNLFSPQESNTAPAENITVGHLSIHANNPSESGRRERWTWLAAAALVLLWVEWWVYNRRSVTSLYKLMSSLRGDSQKELARSNR